MDLSEVELGSRFEELEEGKGPTVCVVDTTQIGLLNTIVADPVGQVPVNPLLPHRQYREGITSQKSDDYALYGSKTFSCGPRFKYHTFRAFIEIVVKPLTTCNYQHHSNCSGSLGRTHS